MFYVVTVLMKDVFISNMITKKCNINIIHFTSKEFGHMSIFFLCLDVTFQKYETNIKWFFSLLLLSYINLLLGAHKES